MAVDFECLNKSQLDRYGLMYCLVKIKEGYINTEYVDNDDICNFLRHIKKPLYQVTEQLHQEDSGYGLDSILENVFDVLLHIHERTGGKDELLEEFNTIHEILEGYLPEINTKEKLRVLKELYGQCKVYYDRTFTNPKGSEKGREMAKVTREDFEFLGEDE